MAEDTILLIEKQSSRAPTFEAALERKGYHLAVVPTGSGALGWAKDATPVMVILNAASLGSSGVRICAQVTEAVSAPVIHILAEDAPRLDHNEATCDVRLRLPFTARKLVNRIKRLLPVGDEELVRLAGIELATGSSVVRVHGRETRLTPKAASLLELFLQHPGETLERSFLMRQVWDTAYVGDTRTLDVHVRWVRQAIEPDPGSPTFIRTVRGKGYRFDDPARAKGKKSGK